MKSIIKDYENYLIYSDGRIWSNKAGRFLKVQLDTCGYPQVGLYNETGQKTTSVHRLVAEHFINGNEKGLQVNHINGIKTDNRIENLEWLTHSQNAQHAHDTGLMNTPNGSAQGSSKLVEKNIPEIFKRLASGETGKSIGDFFGVTGSAISLIKRGKNWAHMTQGLR